MNEDFEQELRKTFAEPFELRQTEANKRYVAGELPYFSTGIDGSITCGYGIQDFNGFWQYPLDDVMVESILKKKQATRFDHRGK